MIITGRPDDLRQLIFREMKKRRGAKKIPLPQRCYGLFDVSPGGVLGQDRPYHHLEGFGGGPPVELSEIPGQPLVDLPQLSLAALPILPDFRHFTRGTKKVAFPRLIKRRMLPFPPAFAISF
jgi:hypothetical protein